MRVLYRAIRRERNIKLIIALSLMFIGVMLPYFYFQKNKFIWSIGLAALAIGIWLMFSIIRTPQAVDERLWFLLNKETKKIVWVFSISTQRMPFGFHLWDAGTMYFKLVDGDELTINVPTKKLKMVSKFLNRLLPHASFGFTEERQAQFEEDPKLLLKK